MIKIATLVYYLILITVSITISNYFDVSDYQWWIIIIGVIGARTCGEIEGSSRL